ncbi:MAG: choice-of-anchor tandem repeat GloVer-containing protein [Bacteroidota bacterium]
MKKTIRLSILFALFTGISHFTVNAQNPLLWGLTSAGGTDTIGTIFKIRGDGTGFQTMQSFTTATGYYPTGTLMVATDNKLYGVAESGGANNKGTIFSLDAANVLTNLHNFTGNAGNDPKGKLLRADNGNFYGMTFYDDSIGAGVIYKYNPVSHAYAKLATFNGTGNGQSPRGSLMQASNGKIYGMAQAGGANQYGTLISFDTITKVITNLHSFAVSSGYNPFGDLIQASNGLLYGLDMYVGSINATPGSIFSFDPATNTFTDKVHFNTANGGFPQGSLMQASDGKLYGMTSGGGSSFEGVLFRYDITGNLITVLANFTGLNGNQPKGNLFQASDGNLYGMTSLGGANNLGVIFKYNLNTSTYSVIHDFNGSQGSKPFGSLVEYNPSGVGVQNFDSKDNSIGIYPNPSNGMVTITFSSVPNELEVIDATGKTVYATKPTNLSTTLNLQNKAKGIYLIKCRDSKTVTTQKIIIE